MFRHLHTPASLYTLSVDGEFKGSDSIAELARKFEFKADKVSRECRGDEDGLTLVRVKHNGKRALAIVQECRE